jgi:glucose/arabinose dehydrogenase
MHAFVENLNFPTSIALDDADTVYIAESGLPFGGAPHGGSVSRIGADGSKTVLLAGLRAPVNGLTFHQGSLIISEGGHPGRISRLDLASGAHSVILDHLPGFGNYHTNMALVGPDGKLYFSQGAMTNSGVIGADSNDLAWLKKIQHNYDLPGYDITLAGFTATTPALDGAAGDTVHTGAFTSWGTVLPEGTAVAACLPCTSAVMRCGIDGSDLELVAWGVRNAYGLCFLDDGRLIATDQGADARGVRPISECPDFLYQIEAGGWYGWPDYYGGTPVTDARFRAPDGSLPGFVLRDHASLPPPRRALLDFAVNACAVKMAQVPAHFPSHQGELVVAQFGDERPMTGPPGRTAGRNLVRVSPSDWSLHDLPALPLSRPLDIVFCAHSATAYVVDFGHFEFRLDKSISATAASGRVWQLPANFMEGPPMPTVSFEHDIAPLFRQFRASMMWRMDLTRYEDVKLNAKAIQKNIAVNGGMPPPPFPRLTDEQIALFDAWIKADYPA